MIYTDANLKEAIAQSIATRNSVTVHTSNIDATIEALTALSAAPMRILGGVLGVLCLGSDDETEESDNWTIRLTA